MSTQYKSSRDVPLPVIVNRLNELSDAITAGRHSRDCEFTMRIPAECDRDADLVLAEAARRIESLQAELEARPASSVPPGWTLTKHEYEVTTIHITRDSDGAWCGGGLKGDGGPGLRYEFLNDLINQGLESQS